MRSLKGINIGNMLMFVGLLVVHSITFAQDLDVTKAGVVKITTTTGQTGTGFIVRVEPEVVYIITAAHVIVGDNQPEVEFFTKRHVTVKGAVLPGAEVNDDLRGLALVVVREKANIPDEVSALPFGTAKDLVSGGEEVLVIGHSGGGGNWAVLKRNISNRVGREISLDPGVASRFSGAPIIVQNQVVGIVMSNRNGFGLGLTHKSVLNFMEGFEVVPGDRTGASKKKSRGAIDLISPGKPLELVITQMKSLPPKINEEDEAVMILVRSGNFYMGSDLVKKDVESYEHPQHEIFLHEFYIDQNEVTVDLYNRFMIQQTKRSPPKYWGLLGQENKAQKPVVGVDWHDAQAYCSWAGKRLPSEAEWEKAARGNDKRTYPWGEAVPNSTSANFGKDRSVNFYMDRLKNVGTYEEGKSPYGIYDMAGNAWEWVADWYSPDYYQDSPKKNPKGPLSGDQKILRGGSWAYDEWHLPTFRRSWANPNGRGMDVGFRCAKDLP